MELFDWDDINVGSVETSHSFFSKKHYKHERMGEMELLEQKMIKSEINDTATNENLGKDKDASAWKCVPPLGVEEQKLIKSEINNTARYENLGKDIDPSAGKCVPLPSVNENAQTSASNLSLPKKDEIAGKNHLQVKQEPCQKIVSNLACQWSTQKQKRTALRSMPPPPQAYLVKDVFQRKREEAERRTREEERKLREFHSRPAPKFNRQLLHKRAPTHAVTVAVTPQVLKKSREADEKRKKKLEEWKKKLQPPKFESQPPKVLKEKPFVPEKKPIVIQQCPFKLQMEKRLKERKQYDELQRKALKEKLKQEEEVRERIEEERIRELRKATIFKATPNPFKN